MDEIVKKIREILIDRIIGFKFSVLKLYNISECEITNISDKIN
jgi:hypothetical protein